MSIPTNITVTARCTQKNLGQGSIPPGGGTATEETVSAQMQIVSDASNSNSITGTIYLTYPLADDTIMVGNYYSLTIVDGTAPSKTHAA
jgi:hypothetical protein